MRVVTRKVADVAPAETRTLAGTVAFVVLELVSVTMAPPAGAGPFKVTVAVGVWPRVTLVRSSVVENAWRVGATVCVAVFEVPPDAAVIVTLVFAETVRVVTAKVVDVVPAGTVTFVGTVAAARFELVRVTTVPPVAAAPFNVTVAVDVEDPKAVDGARLTEYGIGTAEVVSATVRLPPAFVAVIVVDPVVDASRVGIANVPSVAPAGIVMLAGTVARVGTELVRVTTAPPAGAGAYRVTVPVTDMPPTTLAGDSVTAETRVVTVRVAVLLTALYVAVRMTVAFVVTVVVVTANVAVVAPWATVTLAGTEAAALLLESVTTAPPVGAAASRVTVAVEPVPPTTLAGATETPERFAADAGTATKTTARMAPKRLGLKVRFM